MKKLGLALGASLMSLSMGCAFLGFSGVPPQASPSPGASASPTPAPTPTPTPSPTPSGNGSADPLVAGKAVFSANCQSCHGADGKSIASIQGQTVTQIEAKGSMGSIDTMTATQKSDLVAYLAALPKIDAGKTLYGTNCQSCHNADGKGLSLNIQGKTLAEIEAKGTMGGLNTMTADQKDSLVNYLWSLAN